MSKLFTEAGFLSNVGKETFAQVLDKEIRILLNAATTENEIRLIGSLIQQRVGELTTTAAVDKNQKLAQLRSMSKADWKVYLTEKYGEDYFLKASLTPEELECCPTVSKEEIEKALEEGAKARKAFADAVFLDRITNPDNPYK
jgi:hypothetical protein